MLANFLNQSPEPQTQTLLHMSVAVLLPVFVSICVSVFVGNIYKLKSRSIDRAPSPAHFPDQFSAPNPSKNTFCNLDKHTLQFGKIHLEFQANNFFSIDKYSLYFFNICINILCIFWQIYFSIFDKYILPLDKYIFKLKSRAMDRDPSPPHFPDQFHAPTPLNA